jgi:hypothetical protein
MMRFLDRLPPVWRQRVIGIAIGAPLGILVAILTWWISR